MVRLLADGGATSVEWALIDGIAGVQYFRGKSLSPVYVTGHEARQRLRETFQTLDADFFTTVDRVDFFGAACGPDQQGDEVEVLLRESFPHALVHVGSDMEIAALALYTPGELGCVAILGTGSNAGFYDGAQLSYARPSLGYILGDEGSGASIGRIALRDWLYGNLPATLSLQYEQCYSTAWGVMRGPDGKYSTRALVERVLQGEEGSAFLSQFAGIVLQNLDNPYSHSVVHHCFTEFVEQLLVPNLHSESSRCVGAVGSVAWYGRPILAEVCSGFGIELHNVWREPLKPAVERLLS